MTSLIHHASPECGSAGFQLFDVPPTSIDTTDVLWVQHFPINTSAGGAPIEFQITTNGSEYYLDLDETYLHCVVKVTNADGTALLADAKVAPVNNSLHSFFQQIDVYMNETLVSASDSCYPYRALLENWLSHSDDAKKSQLCSEGWYADQPDKHDETDTTKNSGFKARNAKIALSKQWDLYGKLHCDFFQQKRHILNNVDVRIRLIRSANNFALMCGDAGQSPKVEIIKSVLYVKKIKASPNILLSHSKVLDSVNARYPLRKVECKVFTLPSGALDGSIDSAINGTLPTIVGVVCVKNSAFSGSYVENPFKFQHYNITQIGLSVDGKLIPTHHYTPDFTNDLYVRSYMSLYSATGRHQRDKGLGLTYDEYKGGQVAHFFDLTPDHCATADHLSLTRQGTVRVELKFGTALPHPVNVILYCAYQTVAEIDKNRSVLLDH